MYTYVKVNKISRGGAVMVGGSRKSASPPVTAVARTDSGLRSASHNWATILLTSARVCAAMALAFYKVRITFVCLFY